MATSKINVDHPLLKSNFPVLVPKHDALYMSDAAFDEFVRKSVAAQRLETQGENMETAIDSDKNAGTETESTFSNIDTPPSTTAEVEPALARAGLEEHDVLPKSPEHPFMKGLTENKMFTENDDVAYRSTTSAIVDLFQELEDVVSGPRLRELLNGAWKDDALATLKIIFNARSIHLGKSSRPTFYRCCGWLAKNHPLTLLANLRWLSRPVIAKKVGKKKEDGDDDLVVIEPEADEGDPARFDVQNGVAHGYWKDLLNLLVLAANDALDVLASPTDITNVHAAGKKAGKKAGRVWDAQQAKELRGEQKLARHSQLTARFASDAFYRALHLTVARLFAEQLTTDLTHLRSAEVDKKALRQISLCAKWAPSPKLFHDKHTCIASTIAEILHPQSQFPHIEPADRDAYLRFARDAYRKDCSALRRALGVVERDISAGNFARIKYDRLPSQAMRTYTPLFARKDLDRFDQYITRVAQGKAAISGATLLPSTLIHEVRASLSASRSQTRSGRGPEKGAAHALVAQKLADIKGAAADGQWNALVQRVRDSGTLGSAIAVCDVSGSMSRPVFADGTCPLDAAIGLALLIAEVGAPPFGGAFVTFSARPQLQRVGGAGDARSLHDKVALMQAADWAMNTDLCAVFDRLLLPMARRAGLARQHMVRTVFVFSDMQFDAAADGRAWTSSFDRIRADFAAEGYEIPALVFWNLAGGRAGLQGRSELELQVANAGDPTAPKPVLARQPGAALVSGYSQGMLKMFLDNGSFEEPEEEEGGGKEDEVKDKEDEEGNVLVERPAKMRKMDPLGMTRRAISHRAYSMLAVVD